MIVVLPMLLLLVFSGSSPTAVRGTDDEYGYTVVAMSSLQPHATCSGHRVIPPHNGSWVPLHRPPGPCSPPSSSSSGGATAKKPPPPSSSLLADLLRQDQLRVDDIHRRMSSSEDVGDSKLDPVDFDEVIDSHHQITLEVNYGTDGNSSKPSESVVVVDYPAATAGGGGGRRAAGSRSGLPGVVQTVLLDTASDVPWVQCVPCPVPPCHRQTGTLYDPTRSPTYAAFSCNSATCRRLGPYANGCASNGNQCQYRVRYADGSSSSGTYSSDQLIVGAASNPIGGFQFGCSRAETGRGFDSRVAGIMALGGGAQSLVSQTAATHGNVFSYCLPPTESYKGFFVLGVPRVAATRYTLTPMLRDNKVRTFYRVLLRDITVAGKKLNVPAVAFAAGTVLDTRTVITRLPPTAYQALRSAFRSSMAMYRSAPPKGALDTCYDFTGVAAVRLPKIELVFDGRNAAVELDPSAVLFNGCLAFVPNRDDRRPGILGNVQQQTIEVLYNVGGGLVGFRRGAC